MTTKLQTYVNMTNQTAANLTRNLENWTGFRTTASRLYKYPFPDQFMIYAQKASSTAVADFDTWTKKLNYYVRKGAKGLALVHIRNGYPSIRYVFDISDTGSKKGSHRLYLLQYKEEYRDIVSVSIAYILILRCGLQSEKYFRIEDFQNLCDFNTQRLIQIVGTAVSQSSEQVLHQIAISILNYERSKTKNYDNATSHNSIGNAQTQKPTIKEIYELYKPVIRKALLHDEAYQNACKNSSKENAVLEFKAAIKRAALSVKDLKFMRMQLRWPAGNTPLSVGRAQGTKGRKHEKGYYKKLQAGEWRNPLPAVFEK